MSTTSQVPQGIGEGSILLKALLRCESHVSVPLLLTTLQHVLYQFA